MTLSTLVLKAGLTVNISSIALKRVAPLCPTLSLNSQSGFGPNNFTIDFNVVIGPASTAVDINV